MNEHELRQAIAEGAALDPPTPAGDGEGWTEPITSQQRVRRSMWDLSRVLCDYAPDPDDATQEQASCGSR